MSAGFRGEDAAVGFSVVALAAVLGSEPRV